METILNNKPIGLIESTELIGLIESTEPIELIKKTITNELVKPNDFPTQKQELIVLLDFLSNKILFPSSLIKSLKKTGLNSLSSYMDGYNSHVIKARNLIQKISLMNSWGLILNSYTTWKYSAVMAGECINKYIDMILQYIKNSSVDFRKVMILTQSGVSINNFALFFCIGKESGEYICTLKEKNKVKLTRYQIEKLFPRCLDSSKIKIGAQIYNLYENPHQLDSLDIFV